MLGMRGKRVAQAVGTALLAPALVVAMTSAAHADSDTHWVHKKSDHCLYPVYDKNAHPTDVTLRTGCSDRDTDWHDVNNGDGTWLERSKYDPGYCMVAYTDHDAYMEPCNGNDYQRWEEIDTGHGWNLKNKATHECLDSNGDRVYMLACNGGDYQLWL